MRGMIDDTIELLTRTPATLDALLRDLPESWTHRNEGSGTWTVFDVIGHLIEGEKTDWIPRAKLILQYGASKPFEKFDRTAQERDSRGKSLGELLDQFTLLRSRNIAELRALNLNDAQLALPGRHPALGSVTLGQLLATWAAHDLTHLHQISRVMAHQYRDDVGPWSRYLGVMKCEGHSE